MNQIECGFPIDTALVEYGPYLNVYIGTDTTFYPDSSNQSKGPYRALSVLELVKQAGMLRPRDLDQYGNTIRYGETAVRGSRAPGYLENGFEIQDEKVRIVTHLSLQSPTTHQWLT